MLNWKNIPPFIAICVLALFATTGDAAEMAREFSRFSVELPAGWDGEEKTGFVSDNPDEYLLTLGKTDAGGDEILAQISVYILPNVNAVSAADAARRLAEAQGGSDEPRREGVLWTFTGEPRTKIIKGRAVTYANATPEKMLIIIAQDPKNLGAAEILASLRGLDQESAALLGR